MNKRDLREWQLPPMNTRHAPPPFQMHRGSILPSIRRVSDKVVVGSLSHVKDVIPLPNELKVFFSPLLFREEGIVSREMGGGGKPGKSEIEV